MRRLLVPTLAAAIAFAGVAAGPESARAAADHEVELTVGESTTVEGGVPQGVNVSNQTEQSCSKGPADYCETILVHLTNPYEEENAKKGRERATATFVLTTPDEVISDYDLYLYESDADGSKGDAVGTAGEFPILVQTSTETATATVSTTEESPEMWILVEVSYFTAASPYTMSIDFAA